LKTELDAMQTIAKALASVRDHDARLRIVRWTNERFAGAMPPAPDAASAARRTAAADPDLSVDGLDLFDDQAIVDTPADEPIAAAPGTPSLQQPLDSLVRRFATDFRALVAQWQSA
jgi:hypothetical protein